jgi:20S proteasome subunit beta 2
MDSVAADCLSSVRGGFDFDNAARNTFLGTQSGVKLPKFRKTGTTIVGLVYKDGVVLGADTRATEDTIICDKNCEKIHFIADNIWCCGAGTAADTQKVTEMISSDLELHRLDTGSQPRVVTAMTKLKRHLFQYMGHVSAALVLGGVDCNGAHLYTVYPHGSTDKLPYVTMGSGSLAAMAIFEQGYKDNMDEKEAIDLVDRAIASGVFNDLGSGGNIDLMVINKEGFKNLRNYKTPNERVYPRRDYIFPRGSTEVLEQTRTLFRTQIEVEDAKMQE